MNALDLAIENGVRIDDLSRCCLEPVGELTLASRFGREERLLKAGIAGQRL